MATHSDSHPHTLPYRLYVTVLVTLLILTVITVAASKVDFGNPNINIIVAMLIASVKALIVALFFMHLKYESPLTWLYAGLPIFLLVLMLGGIFIDSPFRRDAKAIGNKVKIIQEVAPAMPAHAEHH